MTKVTRMRTLILIQKTYTKEMLKMITNQRLVELLEGSEPITQEEKEWLENHYKQAEQRKKEREDFQRRLHAARKEYKELFNKYAPPEYKKGGLFRTKRFKRIERHVEKKVEKQILKMDLETNGELFYEFYKSKHKMLKEKYNIDWYVCYDKDFPEEYHKEVKAIEEKYNIRAELFYSED